MNHGERVLLLAPRGRDAQVIEQLLTRDGHAGLICPTLDCLADALVQGAGTAVVTEEALDQDHLRALTDWLDRQPPWSDFPFILLATKRSGRRPKAAVETLERLGNVVVLERPVHSETLSSAVESALRGRRRQYEAQARLDALERAEERLSQLNGSLEGRIAQRTHELATVNSKLLDEIEQRERAQEALLQSQKMEAVGQLTGGIAHDFNNLLTAIGGSLELIQRRSEDERVLRLAGNARQAADRAAKLTGQLLAFSRTQRLTLKPVRINRLLRGMDDLLVRTIGPRFEVEMVLDASDPWAMADANQVELAVLNLAINARDAMPEGGRLELATACSREPPSSLPPGDYALIRVTDEGSGIAPAVLDKVFDPFFTTKPLGKGTGLGLSQVYGLARQSGGTARIDSVEGAGATVEIWLQRAAPEGEQEAEPGERRVCAPGARERVLVVEDDIGVREFLVECLQSLGYTVSAAADGGEGLASLQAEEPELLIVDFAMPGLSGAEVVREARRLAPKLPVLMATGYADMEAVSQVIDPARVLRKPFEIDDLQRAVRKALSGS